MTKRSYKGSWTEWEHQTSSFFNALIPLQ